jgi:hypothetical protein
VDDNLIPARAVTALLQEILTALDTGTGDRSARESHAVRALRHLLAGPVPAEGDLVTAAAILHTWLAETPAPLHLQPGADPDDGPFSTREQAETVFAAFRDAAAAGRSGPPGEELVFTRGQHLADALTDTIEGFGADLGDYDRELIERLAGLLDPVEMRVACSWIYRVDSAIQSGRDDA